MYMYVYILTNLFFYNNAFFSRSRLQLNTYKHRGESTRAQNKIITKKKKTTINTCLCIVLFFFHVVYLSSAIQIVLFYALYYFFFFFFHPFSVLMPVYPNACMYVYIYIYITILYVYVLYRYTYYVLGTHYNNTVPRCTFSARFRVFRRTTRALDPIIIGSC